MVVETKFGNFEILKNERDAFDIVKFEAKYLPEYFDKYTYLVGDLADDILRLKGFSKDSKSSSYFHYIPEYLQEACAYNCKYYILKRVEEVEQVIEEVIIEDIKEEKKEEKPEQNKFKKKHKYFKKHFKKGGNKNESRTNN